MSYVHVGVGGILVKHLSVAYPIDPTHCYSALFFNKIGLKYCLSVEIDLIPYCQPLAFCIKMS